nr:substrate-binding domain-containing protein [Armatimonas sp.]
MKKFIGLILLLAVVGAAAFLTAKKSSNAPTVLRGFVGGEKTTLLADPEFQKLLKERHGLVLEADKRGSLEMVTESDTSGKDFLWPSSSVALALYKDAGKPLVASENVLNSPLVLYTWAKVAQTLTQQKLDFPRLVGAAAAGKTWKELGLPELYGKVVIYTTDPLKSSSGNLYAGLLQTVLGTGSTEKVKTLIMAQGFQESSSDTLFTQYVSRGIGDKPIIVGYEAQLIDFARTAPAQYAAQKGQLRVLYPKPTVWSSHPVLALTTNGKKLIVALQDPEIQKLAWERHGFRSATGTLNDPKACGVEGVPATIESVVPVPDTKAMQALLSALR